jgi:peptide/nickel transport system substrate-binding protein
VTVYTAGFPHPPAGTFSRLREKGGHAVALVVLFLLAGVGARAEAPTLQETPSLAAAVAAGKMPPVADRLPKVPRVIDLGASGRSIGRHGGTLRLLMGDQRDIRYMTIYGYARLVVFNTKTELEPDILESYDETGGRIFTLHLRPGHKWSDGQPFTAEDFRYWWEDVANNTRLSPGGPPQAMLMHGKPPKFEVLDPLTVRYSWDDPNPVFLPALADAQPLYIFMPAHYLKQFHAKYADPAQLAAAIKRERVRDWGSLHERMSRQYRPENPALPTLEPWVNTTESPSEFYVFKRNPYFHRIDEAGHQLPYIDTVSMTLSTPSLIPAKVGSGEADLQARYLRFDNYTFLKEAARRNDYKIRLWKRAEGAYLTLRPNLNAADPVWRSVFRDVRVRRALSLAINRGDINRVVFFGLATEAGNSVLPESSLYRPRFAKAYTNYDPETAGRLLDAAGLDKRDADGVRLLPDGRRMEFTVEAAGDNPDETDMLELVADNWRKIGVKIFPRSTQRDLFRRKIALGETLMSVWQGHDNGIPGPDTEPDDLAPTSPMQFQWPKWGLYVESNGREGRPVDDPAAQELLTLYRDWRRSETTAERRVIWEKMLSISSEQVFTIGIVSETAQPVVVSDRLHNVPEKGLYSFEPGAFFGMYQPDTFWFEKPAGD